MCFHVNQKARSQNSVTQLECFQNGEGYSVTYCQKHICLKTKDCQGPQTLGQILNIELMREFVGSENSFEPRHLDKLGFECGGWHSTNRQGPMSKNKLSHVNNSILGNKEYGRAHAVHWTPLSSDLYCKVCSYKWTLKRHVL